MKYTHEVRLKGKHGRLCFYYDIVTEKIHLLKDGILFNSYTVEDLEGMGYCLIDIEKEEN